MKGTYCIKKCNHFFHFKKQLKFELKRNSIMKKLHGIHLNIDFTTLNQNKGKHIISSLMITKEQLTHPFVLQYIYLDLKLNNTGTQVCVYMI